MSALRVTTGGAIARVTLNRPERRNALSLAVMRELLETHERLTGSRVARSLLRFDRHLAGFCRITPVLAAVIPSVEIEAERVAQAG